MHQNMLEGGHPKGGKFCKDLRVVLKRVQERIDSLKIRIEAVFLPYKAAMWDSLESVWKEAEADPDCDAYVVPIPYYDKKPDGSFGEKHDESGLYPEYVPIVKYDAYDFAFHKPDIIFIHNPYDGGNYVTHQQIQMGIIQNHFAASFFHNARPLGRNTNILFAGIAYLL